MLCRFRAVTPWVGNHLSLMRLSDLFIRSLLSSLALAVALHATDQPSRLVTYSAPAGVPLNDDFTVKVRTPGGAWQGVPSYLVTVDRVTLAVHERMHSSMAIFDFAGHVEVSVTSRRGRIESARVRPLSFGLAPQIKGDTLTFTLDRPRNLSVEVNGDVFGNLQVFANPIETERPDPKDPNVIYLGPGLHELQTPSGELARPPWASQVGGPRPGAPSGASDPSTPTRPRPSPPPDSALTPVQAERRAHAREAFRHMLRVPSGKTLYIAGGAVVRGRIICDHAEKVRIIGRGIVAQSDWGGGIRISNSAHVEVSGIFTPQCFTGGSRQVKIENVKCVSYLGNGDGMNVVCSEDVVIDGVFNRNSDDCITVYGTRNGFTGGARRVTVQNSTLWADLAHPILVGTHGNTPNPETLEDLEFVNLDILDHKEAQFNYQGVMALNAGDSNLIRRVRFEDIRVEDFRQGQLVNLRVFFNRKYCTSPGRGVEDVFFKNVFYNGTHASTSIISGYDEQRKVKDIVFENLVINGVVISDDMKKPAWYTAADMAGIAVGEHVDGLVFRRSASSEPGLKTSN